MVTVAEYTAICGNNVWQFGLQTASSTARYGGQAGPFCGHVLFVVLPSRPEILALSLSLPYKLLPSHVKLSLTGPQTRLLICRLHIYVDGDEGREGKISTLKG